MTTRGRVSRRFVLGSAAGAITGLSPLARAGEPLGSAATVELRLLETSDLHMFVMDWDYFHAKLDPTVGVSRVASLIRAARRERVNTLLFDNGDFLQGTPLADFVAGGPRPSAGAPHPIVAIMTALGYDAITVGNHEFNYGLEFLEASIAGAPFPVVCANVTRAGGAPFLAPTAILERKVRDTAGGEHTLRIGVIGFVTPQIMMWDKARLEGRIESSDIVLAARKQVPALRAACDVVVALSHSGIRADAWEDGMENASFHLAGVPGIDVIMTGHSHRVFPSKDYANLDGVDAVAGRLNGLPAVMPGFWGSHLGVVDLQLVQAGGRWTVSSAHVEARPIYRRDQGKVIELTQADSAVAALIEPVHRKTVAFVEQPAGALDARLTSYFTWAGADPATALVNEAQAWYARPLLAKTQFAGLPLLSSAAPYRVGYTPDSFIDIAKGAIALRQIADLYIYSSNTLTAVKVTGGQIREWLEIAARVFNTIDPAAPGPQPLIAKGVPSYNFDVISGVSYAIDITKPPRYDKDGRLTEANRRIAELTFEGRPIEDQREFVVLTNNYRADGGGSFAPLRGAPVVLRAPDTNRDAVLAYVRSRDVVAVPKLTPWRFAPTGRTATVTFDSGVAAAAVEPKPAGVSVLGEGEPGYTRLALVLG